MMMAMMMWTMMVTVVMLRHNLQTEDGIIIVSGNLNPGEALEGIEEAVKKKAKELLVADEACSRIMNLNDDCKVRFSL